MLTQERLKEFLSYNPDTGVFTWIKKRAHCTRVGAEVGKPMPSGYVRFMLDGKLCLAHRMAWLYTHGKFTKSSIDHINGIKSDNRICNLREATDLENNRNVKINKKNTSGYKGVSFDKNSGKWRAATKVDYKYVHIGLFEDPLIAHHAYQDYISKHHGEFKYTN